ncbi:hypothetical protein KA005_43255 [bacterium]|nr:hypothetical protein [bacterium]
MRQRAILVMVAALVFGFLFSSEVFALDIVNVDIWHSKDYYDGLPIDQSKYALTPWDFGIGVQGIGITSVSVTLPNSNTLDLEDIGDGEWEIEIIDFNSATEWLTDYPMGTYTFSFNGGSDSVAVVHNETEPGGIANITFPDNDANDVPYENPVFTWDSCVGLGDSLRLHVGDELLVESIFKEALPATATSVTITGLLPARHCYFGIDLCNTTKGDETTVGGDSFWYVSNFTHFNEVEFQTLPIPGDFQKDGKVNLLDFALLAQAWQTTPIDPAWNAACDISKPKDNIINLKDLGVMSQHWMEVNGNIFDSTSATITNPLLGLTNVGDSYSMSGYGTLAGADRSYSLIGAETVMGVECLILKISGYGEMPTTNYYDIRITQDIAGYIRVLKITGFEEGSQMSWQSEAVNFSPIFLPSEEGLEVGQIYPLWADNYNKVIAIDQTVDLMSTGAGPYTGCLQYNWNSDDGAGGIDVDENYICPGFGYVKEVWNDDGLDGFERNP